MTDMTRYDGLGRRYPTAQPNRPVTRGLCGGPVWLRLWGRFCRIGDHVCLIRAAQGRMDVFDRGRSGLLEWVGGHAFPLGMCLFLR